MTAPSHTNELKIPEKVLTMCSKSGVIEKRLVRSMSRQVFWEIPVVQACPDLKWEIPSHRCLGQVINASSGKGWVHDELAR